MSRSISGQGNLQALLRNFDNNDLSAKVVQLLFRRAHARALIALPWSAGVFVFFGNACVGRLIVAGSGAGLGAGITACFHPE
jgi:hypothetical protein